jgi:hypothetical protein
MGPVERGACQVAFGPADDHREWNATAVSRAE